MLKPVVLPSGLVRERTKPCATMSVEFPSIGMVFVACCAARTAGSPAQMITSTLADDPCRVLRKLVDAKSVALRIDHEVLPFDEPLSA